MKAQVQEKGKIKQKTTTRDKQYMQLGEDQEKEKSAHISQGGHTAIGEEEQAAAADMAGGYEDSKEVIHDEQHDEHEEDDNKNGEGHLSSAKLRYQPSSGDFSSTNRRSCVQDDFLEHVTGE